MFKREDTYIYEAVLDMALEAPQPSPCRVELLSAFRDRERVKQAGATWESQVKRWVVYTGHDLRSVREVFLRHPSLYSLKMLAFPFTPIVPTAHGR